MKNVATDFDAAIAAAKRLQRLSSFQSNGDTPSAEVADQVQPAGSKAEEQRRLLKFPILQWIKKRKSSPPPAPPINLPQCHRTEAVHGM